MIAHLRGRLLSKTPNQAIVECAGVGYDVTISVATFSSLPGEGAEAALHIHTHVREDQIALFGFSETQEKRLFEKLLTISGIGPKLAITVLSGIDSSRLVTAIRSGDHATLTRIPGIGKKTAERVVLELKDKLDDLAVSIPTASGGPTPRPRRRRCPLRPRQPRLCPSHRPEGHRDRDRQGPRRSPRLRNPLPRRYAGHPLVPRFPGGPPLLPGDKSSKINGLSYVSACKYVITNDLWLNLGK